MNRPNFLISLITENNDYQLEQAAAAQAAGQKLGAQVQIIYANNDAVQQTQQILSFIQESGKRPDAILVEPVGTGMLQVARAAVSAGIGWALINSGLDYIPELRQNARVPVFALISDHEEIGRIQGRQIASLAGEQGCIVYLEGPGIRHVAKVRTRGMMATKPPMVTVKTLKGDWTQQSGHHAVKSWLSLSTSRDLGVTMIVSQNDDMAMGARRAFEELRDIRERDAWLKLPLTGCDGVSKAGQAWVRQGLLAATVISPPLMGDAIDMMAAALNGGPRPPEQTLIAPSSFPALSELQKSHGKAQTAS